jgi:hypothetical protein
MSSVGPDAEEVLPSRRSKRRPWIPPQNAVNNTWTRFSAKIFSKVTTVLPVSEYPHPVSRSQGQSVATNFEEAAKACREKVRKIVEENTRVNQRYRDPHFDIDLDLKLEKLLCLGTLTQPAEPVIQNEGNGKMYTNPYLPKSVKRVHVSEKVT